MYAILNFISSCIDYVNYIYNQLTYVEFKIKKITYHGNFIKVEFIKKNKKYIYELPCLDLNKLPSNDKIVNAYVNDQHDVTHHIETYAGPQGCFFNKKHNIKKVLPEKFHCDFKELTIITSDGDIKTYKNLNDIIHLDDEKN